MKDLIVNEMTITTDIEGRYSLNDLHRAAGGEKKHQPAFFMQNNNFKNFLELLTHGKPRFEPMVRKQGRYGGGTWVCKELVYKYAMWINPHFELKVIQTFDKLMIDSYEKPASMAALNELTAKIESDKDVASFCGKELNKYKRIKKENKDAFDLTVEQAQLSLGFTGKEVI